jgi:tetratricopeptide (TPR) repeat protein
VNRIAARSGGNPFFARALSRMPSAARRPATRLPAAIRRLVSERFARLGAGDRELLDMCACYGSRIELPVVAGALGIPVPDVLRRLASIAAESDLLVRAGTDFAFDHHLIVEALVRGIPAGRRRGYYATLARALEASVPVPVPGDAAVALCRLYLDGNRPVDALRHLDSALDALTSAHARADAAHLCDRVLALPGLVAGARRLELLVRAEEMGQSLGRDTSLLLEEALANATERGDAPARARILVQSARRLYARGHNDRAVALLDEAERTAPDPQVDLVRGQLFHTLGRPDEACARLEQAIRRGRANGDARLEVRAMGVLCSILVNRGRLAEARAAAEATLALSKATHDLEGEVIALHGLINTSLQAEEYARAEEVIRQQLELVRRLSDRRAEGRARRGLACCLQMQGDLVGARREFERARDLAEAIGDLLNEAQATGDLGALRFGEGRLSDALALSERAISLSERTAQPVGQSVAHHMAGGACVFLGMPEMARSRFEAALAISRRHGIRFGEAYALQGLADVHALRSTGDDVLARYEEALAVRREAAPDAASSELLLPIASLFLRRDEPERARPYVERVLAAGDIGSRTLAAGYFAVLPGVDVRRAVESIMELDPRAPVLERMTARFLAWRVTGEIAHLAEAYRLVLHVREHALPDARDVMLVRVPLYAAIVAAWKEGTLRGRGIYGEP